MKKVGVWVLLLATAGGGWWYFAQEGFSAQEKPAYTLVPVKRGDMVDKALAVGKIEPRKEIAVKSKISGIVSKIYVEVGDIVKAGEPLFEISPDPTPYEYAEARMAVEMAEVAYSNARKTHERNLELFRTNMIPQENLENTQLELDQARLQHKLAQEKLNLLMEGRTEAADQDVENVVRSPIHGMVLQRQVNEGDPVVPLTSYQAGTEMMLLADMEHLIFKGTVDEIDVGRLKEGMPARIKLGAVPTAKVEGTLSLIAPKAALKDNATLFDTEIRIQSADNVLLRAGYSANADIIIQEKTGILVIPERLVTNHDDSIYVELKDTPELRKQIITLGISDGIMVEVIEGLQEGDSLVERPPKTIE